MGNPFWHSDTKDVRKSWKRILRIPLHPFPDLHLLSGSNFLPPCSMNLLKNST